VRAAGAVLRTAARSVPVKGQAMRAYAREPGTNRYADDVDAAVATIAAAFAYADFRVYMMLHYF